MTGIDCNLIEERRLHPSVIRMIIHDQTYWSHCTFRVSPKIILPPINCNSILDIFLTSLIRKRLLPCTFSPPHSQKICWMKIEIHGRITHKHRTCKNLVQLIAANRMWWVGCTTWAWNEIIKSPSYTIRNWFFNEGMKCFNKWITKTKTQS